MVMRLLVTPVLLKRIPCRKPWPRLAKPTPPLRRRVPNRIGHRFSGGYANAAAVPLCVRADHNYSHHGHSADRGAVRSSRHRSRHSDDLSGGHSHIPDPDNGRDCLQSGVLDIRHAGRRDDRVRKRVVPPRQSAGQPGQASLFSFRFPRLTLPNRKPMPLSCSALAERGPNASGDRPKPLVLKS